MENLRELKYTEIGQVKSIRGCIIVVTGFKSCINGQLVHFGFGTMGMIVGFTQEEAQVLILKESTPIKTGDEVRASMEPFLVPVGKNFIGRVVNALCEPFDSLGPIQPEAFNPIWPKAPGILDRQVLKEPLETGTKVLDAMIPIGLGQRQLILGNKSTGKTTFITDTILNQKHTGVVCIYCAIGKARSQLLRAVHLFNKYNAFDYTIVVAAPSSSPPGQQYLAPYVACSLGEYFRDRGGSVFIGFDDYTKHAWCYREISLLLGRAPGRDSYPGDIFYLHSKMIERACRLSDKNGGGSMTFLPIVEILEGDLTGYIPTNLISMTDGQVYLDASLFGEGQKPALDLGLSVSRTGTKVQWSIVKDLSAPLRLEYLQYRELVRISRLRAGKQPEEVAAKLKSGEILTYLLRQDKNSPVRMEHLILILWGFHKKHLHKLTIEEVKTFEKDIFPFAQERNPELIKIIRQRKKLDDEIEKGLEEVLQAYIKKVKPKAKFKKEDGEEDAIVGKIGKKVLEETSGRMGKA
ncbi:MAG TPA: F0F1 ATP synthase subunit alpha [Candidatus Omnitrophota bacterium]|nr:F0F1 ATP synthase subunit alpha [Candidatus Omnitrophota bacterium]